MLKRVSRRGRIVLAVVLAAVLGAGTGAGVVLYAAGNGAVRGGQLGALAWYSNNYSTGGLPYATVFDGTSIWTANYIGNSVSKINPSTGAIVGTYNLPAGSGPNGIVLDQPGYSANTGNALDAKTYMWTANYGNNTVSKIDVATGTVIASYPVGSNPWSIAFDGTNIWVTNGGDGTVTKLLIATGARVGTYAVGHSPVGLLFDGTNIWVASRFSNTVTKIQAR